MGNQSTKGKNLKYHQTQNNSNEPTIIYNDRLNLLLNQQFKDIRQTANGRVKNELMNELKDEDFVFTNFMFERIFAPSVDEKYREDC